MRQAKRRRSTAAPATYAYCVLQSTAAPAVAGVPAGLPGTGPLRALPVGGGLWLVAAAAPLPAYAGPAIERGLRDLNWVSERAVAHERVVEHFAARGPALPLKLFTLFADDARAVGSLRRRRATLGRVLARVAGHREWGVRFTLARRAALPRATARPAASRPPSGTAYLTARKTARDDVRDALLRAVADADRVFADLSRRARDARRREPVQTPDGARLLLDAAFLVPRRGEEAFLATARRWSERLAGEGRQLAVTGPWPPYNFVDAR
jgi:hypothetical protein